MTTSGITSYSLTRDNIITAAYRKLGYLAQGQSLSTEDTNNGVVALNPLIARFRALGMPLWKRKEYTFSPTATINSYTIGVGQTLNTPYPLKMLQAFRLDNSFTTRIPVEVVPNFNFNLYPTSSGGSSIQLNYTPNEGYGTIKLWPTPDTSAATYSTITIIYQAPFEYFTAASETLDFPEEWYLPFIYQLAVLLAPEVGMSLPDRQVLKAEADQYLMEILSMGGEDGSLFIQPHRVDQ